MPLEYDQRRLVFRRTGFTPPNKSQLVGYWTPEGKLYQDSARTVLVASHTDPVGSYTDTHGGNHLAQALSASRPTYRTDHAKGVPYVRFDGADDYLRGIFAAASPLHILMAVRYRTAADSKYLWDGQASNQMPAFMVEPTAGNYRMRVYQTGTAAFLDRTVTGSQTSWLVFSVLYNNGAGSYVEANDVRTTGTLAASSFTAFVLGMNGGLSFGAAAIDVGPIGIYTAEQTGGALALWKAHLARWKL